MRSSPRSGTTPPAAAPHATQQMAPQLLSYLRTTVNVGVLGHALDDYTGDPDLRHGPDPDAVRHRASRRRAGLPAELHGDLHTHSGRRSGGHRHGARSARGRRQLDGAAGHCRDRELRPLPRRRPAHLDARHQFRRHGHRCQYDLRLHGRRHRHGRQREPGRVHSRRRPRAPGCRRPRPPAWQRATGRRRSSSAGLRPRIRTARSPATTSTAMGYASRRPPPPRTPTRRSPRPRRTRTPSTRSTRRATSARRVHRSSPRRPTTSRLRRRRP